MNASLLYEKLQNSRAAVTSFAGSKLIVDASGALFLPTENMLVVSDLHFEKGSFLGTFANPIPHYDSHKTLENLADVIDNYSPRHVLCLGDSFHDNAAWQRLPQGEQMTLIDLVEAQSQWTWVLGNHDPELPDLLPGNKVSELRVDNLLFLHEPNLDLGTNTAQVFGHFHPKMSKSVARHRMSGRCFMHDKTKMVMPSFGAYTGGLSIEDEAFEGVFNHKIARKHLIYQDKIYPL